MNTEFIPGVTYKLVEPAKFANALFYKALAKYILETGGTIQPLYVVCGNVMGIRFGDGTIDVNEGIEERMAKYFEPIMPEACSAAQLIPKPNKPLQTAANDPVYDITQPPECLPRRRLWQEAFWPPIDLTAPIQPLAA